ncbi:hypothetical protein U1Q18_036843 [Sarracenia purpurea var. burkii]
MTYYQIYVTTLIVMHYARMHFSHDWGESIFESEVEPKQCSDVQPVGNDEIENEDVGKKNEEESDLIKKLQEQVNELQKKVRMHDNEILALKETMDALRDENCDLHCQLSESEVDKVTQAAR